MLPATLPRRLLPLAAVLSALAASLPAAARPPRDHERARAALESGEILPLSALLAEVEARYHGRVIETELERDDGRWTYEFKLLPPSGRIFEVTLDAATGAVVRTRGPVRLRSP